MGRSFEVRKMSMAKTAAQKSKLYAKYGKQLYVIAKNGGGDPIANPSLKSMIDRAKREQVPAHVIDKAIEKATGAGGEDYSPARYEGYGPGGCSIIIDCLTDNNNRTITDVRNCFTKTGSKMGAPGCATHLFDHLAIFRFAGEDEEPILEAMMEAEVDVQDIESDNGKITVFAPAGEFAKAREAVHNATDNAEMEVEEIAFVPQSRIPIGDEDVPNFEKFINMLNECDDVQEIYHNASLAAPE